MGYNINAQKFVLRNPDLKRPLGRSRDILEDNIKM
jgi:hypothetical protein